MFYLYNYRSFIHCLFIKNITRQPRAELRTFCTKSQKNTRKAEIIKADKTERKKHSKCAQEKTRKPQVNFLVLNFIKSHV